jgi:hypothetical protein
MQKKKKEEEEKSYYQWSLRLLGIFLDRESQSTNLVESG